MTEQQKHVLTAIAGFMLSAACKIDQIETENEEEKSDGVGMIVSGVTQLVERFGFPLIDDLEHLVRSEFRHVERVNAKLVIE